jgi:hypothetical protein
MEEKKKRPKYGGRKKGTPNKNTVAIKTMMFQALDNAGGVKYLERVAKDHPGAFCTLLGKCIPTNVVSEDGSMSPPPTVVKVVAAGDG